jgi:hypothetical protein
MRRTIRLELPLPGNLRKFQLPRGVQQRLAELLDRQDQGERLSATERREAEGLVELAEMLSLLKLRTERSSDLAA